LADRKAWWRAGLMRCHFLRMLKRTAVGEMAVIRVARNV
jgi:hypothetical protein